MAIEFVVEDGTGKTDATSYGSVADFRQYWENRGTDYSTATMSEALAQGYLNAATAYINGLYPWRGVPKTTTQALEFPRAVCYDDRGVDQSGAVPTAIEQATFMAGGHLAEGKTLLAPMENIQSRRMGPVSVTYGSGGQRPVKIPGIERLVGRLVKPMGVER